MARYRHKTPEDLGWNSIRRTITRTYDMAAADIRERDLNEMLHGAWEEYTTALGKGEVRELESKYKALAAAVVRDTVVTLEITGAVADS